MFLVVLGEDPGELLWCGCANENLAKMFYHSIFKLKALLYEHGTHVCWEDNWLESEQDIPNIHKVWDLNAYLFYVAEVLSFFWKPLDT